MSHENVSRDWRRRIAASIALGLLVAVPALGAAGENGKDGEKSSEDSDVKYDVVEKRQTVGDIALEHGASVDDILAWNDIELGEAEEGMKLIVDSEEETEEEKDS